MLTLPITGRSPDSWHSSIKRSVASLCNVANALKRSVPFSQSFVMNRRYQWSAISISAYLDSALKVYFSSHGNNS